MVATELFKFRSDSLSFLCDLGAFARNSHLFSALPPSSHAAVGSCGLFNVSRKGVKIAKENLQGRSFPIVYKPQIRTIFPKKNVAA